MNYERNKKYFTQVANGSAVALLILGIFILIIGLATMEIMIDAEMYFFTSFFVTLGFGLVIGGGILVAKGNSSMTDSEIDAELRRYFEQQNIEAKALEKLGLSEDDEMEIEPISFYGYHFDGVNQVKIGSDNKARSSQARIVYFFFTKNEVYCYTHTVSLIENVYSEDTDTYFYSDIVSVSTVTSNGTVVLPGAQQQQQRSYQYDSFKLTTTGGTSIQVSLYDKSSMDRSINSMRNLIKTKKQG